MWYRVVAIANAESEWEPRWALRCQGGGPYVCWSFGRPQLFATTYDAVQWVKRQREEGAFVELPDTVDIQQ